MGGSDGQAAGSATTVEACEGCTRAVHESGTSGADGARDCAVVHEIAEWCMSTSGARDYVVVHEIVEWCTMVHE